MGKPARIVLGDAASQKVVREMRICSRVCPAFKVCPLMPLSIQPVDARARTCLMNQGPAELRRVYMHLFIEGESGVIDEIKGTVLEYGKLLRECKSGITVKERMRHLKELNGMMLALHKILHVKGGGEEEDEKVEVMGVESESEEELPEDPESLMGSPVVAEMMAKAAGKVAEKAVEPVPVPVEKV